MQVVSAGLSFPFAFSISDHRQELLTALQLCQSLGTASAFPAPATPESVAMASGCYTASGSETPCQGGHMHKAHKKSPFPLLIPLTLPKKHLLVEGTSSPSLIPGPQFWEL